MTEKLYGLDLDKDITPLEARDALVECFFEAHCTDIGLDNSNPEVDRIYIKGIVEKAFLDSDGDFEKPTKQSIINAMGKLQEFAKNFRDPSIIQKHAGEMMTIVEKIKE